MEETKTVAMTVSDTGGDITEPDFSLLMRDYRGWFTFFFFLVFLWFTFLFLFSSCEGCDFSIHSVIYYLECYLLPQNTRIKGKNLNLVNKEPPPLQKHRWGLDKAYQKRKAEAIIQLTHFRLGWQPWGTLSCKTSYSPSNFLNCCTCSLTIKKCNDFFF